MARGIVLHKLLIHVHAALRTPIRLSLVPLGALLLLHRLLHVVKVAPTQCLGPRWAADLLVHMGIQEQVRVCEHGRVDKTSCHTCTWWVHQAV